MSDPTFAIDALVYREIVGVMKPHISKDEHRPVLTGVRVRHNAGAVAFEATDSYTAIRAELMSDDALLGPGVGAFDVLVPGAEFTALKPEKGSLVHFTLHRADVMDEVTGEVGMPGESSITDGTTSIRLLHVDVAVATFPDLDDVARQALFVDPDNPVVWQGWNPRVLARFAKMPGKLSLSHRAHNRAAMFWAQGEGRDTFGATRYQGLMMPVHDDEDEALEAPVWDRWGA